MSYQTQYVHLPDDTLEHIIGDGQRTECGVAIPYNSPWTREPEGKVCAKCTKADKAAEAVVVTPEPVQDKTLAVTVEPPAVSVATEKPKAKSGAKA